MSRWHWIYHQTICTSVYIMRSWYLFWGTAIDIIGEMQGRHWIHIREIRATPRPLTTKTTVGTWKSIHQFQNTVPSPPLKKKGQVYLRSNVHHKATDGLRDLLHCTQPITLIRNTEETENAGCYSLRCHFTISKSSKFREWNQKLSKCSKGKRWALIVIVNRKWRLTIEVIFVRWKHHRQLLCEFRLLLDNNPPPSQRKTIFSETATYPVQPC